MVVAVVVVVVVVLVVVFWTRSRISIRRGARPSV